MSYKERILDYLWSVAPGVATNGQIARALGISSHRKRASAQADTHGVGTSKSVYNGSATPEASSDRRAASIAIRV